MSSWQDLDNMEVQLNRLSAALRAGGAQQQAGQVQPPAAEDADLKPPALAATGSVSGLHDAQGEVEASLKGLLASLGQSEAEMGEAVIRKGAEVLMMADPTVQQALLATGETALQLEQQRLKHADPYPSPSVWPQGWLAWLAYALFRMVLFFLATSLIDMLTMLGFPPYLGWLRAVLVILHAPLAFIIWQLTPGHANELGFSWATLLTFFLLGNSFLLSAYGDKDLPAREAGVKALRRMSGVAKAQQERLQWAQAQQSKPGAKTQRQPQPLQAQQLQMLQGAVFERLFAELAAGAAGFTAVLRRDKQRLKQVQSRWDALMQPTQTLQHFFVWVLNGLRAIAGRLA